MSLDPPVAMATLAMAMATVMAIPATGPSSTLRSPTRYPFVISWDDHEFANGCWQDYANDFFDGTPTSSWPTPTSSSSTARAWAS